MEAKEYYKENNRFKESITSLYEEDIIELMENYAAYVLSKYIYEGSVLDDYNVIQEENSISNIN